MDGDILGHPPGPWRGQVDKNIFLPMYLQFAQHPALGPPKATTLVTHMTPPGQGAQKEKIKMKGSWREACVHLHLSFERFVRTKEVLSSLSKVCNASPAGFHLRLPD